MLSNGKKIALFFIACPFFLFPYGISSQAVQFRFTLDRDDVLIVDKVQDIEIDGEGEKRDREEKNRIVLRVEGREGDRSELSGTFHTYSRSPRRVGNFLSERDFFSRFFIRDNGRYEVPDDYAMPNLRSLPTFPDHPVNINEEWREEAEETIDIENLRIRIPLNVSYRYTGLSEVKPESGIAGIFPRILYSYTFEKEIAANGGGIVRITGYSADELWFDSERGAPVFDTNRLLYRFIFEDGGVLEYRFHIDSRYSKIRAVKEKEKEIIAERAKEALKDESNISVRKNDEGIVLDMDSLFFSTDSASLSMKARNKISIIAEILKKFPQREIRISGHTDSMGDEDHNRRLSEQRALSVLDELKNVHSIDSNRMSYRGYGEQKPVAENTSVEGREKNRRVEILIVTE